MFELTPEFAGGSIIASFIVLLIALGFNVYILYLNFKQAKVNNQMIELLKVVKDIRNLLKKKK